MGHDETGSIIANTVFKIAGGNSIMDGRVIGPEMRAKPEFLQNLPRGHFALYGKPIGLHTITFKPNVLLDRLDKRDDNELQALKEAQWAKYAVDQVIFMPPPASSDEQVGDDWG